MGLIDLRVRDEKTGAPVPNANLVLKHVPEPRPSRPEPVRPFASQQEAGSRTLLVDESGQTRAVLAVGKWEGTVGVRDAYPPAPVSFKVPQCLETVTVRARPLSREDFDAEALQAGFHCDLRALTCRAPGLYCPPGFVAEIRGGCFERCVPLDACLCSEDAACPAGRCDLASGRCR